MMTRYSLLGALLLTVTLFPLATYAAPTVVWTGPGQFACRGQCSLEWALSQLSAEQRDAVEAAMAVAPLGYSIPIRDGAMFSMMSYFNEKAVADMRTTVAVLDADEPATGWYFDGWSFVQISGCQNWAVLMDMPPLYTGGLNEVPQSNGSDVASTGPVASFDFPQMASILFGSAPRLPIVLGDSDVISPVSPTDPDLPIFIPEDDSPIQIVLPDISVVPQPPTVIPLPWSIYLVLISLTSFYVARFLGFRKMRIVQN